MSFIRKIEIEIVSTKHRENHPTFPCPFDVLSFSFGKTYVNIWGEKKEKRKNIRVQMRSPGNVKIKIVQFWKLQKKKKKSTKPVTKIKAIKIHRYLKIPKIEKSLVVEKKKTYRPTRSPNISWNLNFLLGRRKHARNKEG